MAKKDKKYNTILKARFLRAEMTETEKLLWKYLSDRGMCSVKFRRQHPCEGFIIDFYCASHHLAIEIDGGIHKDQKEADAERQYIIEAQGIKVLRFTNEDVINRLDFVLRTIKRTLFPSPRSGEGCHDEVVTG